MKSKLKVAKTIKKQNKVLMFSLLCTSFLLLTLFFTFIPNNKERQVMLSFLNDKYGQEFVVEKIQKSAGGIGISKTISAIAYPVSDPSLKFELVKFNANKLPYTDTYLDIKWTREFDSVVGAYLSENYSRYELNVRTGLDSDSPIFGTSPSFDEIVQKNPGLYNIFLTVYKNKSAIGSYPSSAEFENVYGLLKKMESYRPSGISLHYYYELSNNSKPKYSFYIDTKDSKQLLAPDDIKQYLYIDGVKQ